VEFKLVLFTAVVEVSLPEIPDSSKWSSNKRSVIGYFAKYCLKYQIPVSGVQTILPGLETSNTFLKYQIPVSGVQTVNV